MDPRKVKVRMPKWQNIKSAAWAKELLMTFIGATLSIILTFGTAHFVDQKQQQEDARQMAMMVIHDMENTADLIKSYAKKEDTNFNNALYLMEHLNQPDSITLDSITAFLQYVTARVGDTYVYDNSSEQVFLSSQEAWKTINIPAFIDEVQLFFHKREHMYEVFNHDPFFLQPVPYQTYFALSAEIPDPQKFGIQYILDHIKGKWFTPEVHSFLNRAPERKSYFNRYADEIMAISNKCKFMMGISDEELAQFVENRTRTGKPVKPHQLIGKWKTVSADDISMVREYGRDHSYVYQITEYISYSYYTGQIELVCKLMGTWDLQGDSLFTNIDSCAHEFDKSRIHYLPEKESDIDEFLRMWEPFVEQYEQAILNKEDKSHNAAFVSIDKTGNKMEMRLDDHADYLIRCDTP